MKRLNEKTKTIVAVGTTVASFVTTGLLGWASNSILNNSQSIVKNSHKIGNLEQRSENIEKNLEAIETKVPLELYIKDLQALEEKKVMENRILEKRLKLLKMEIEMNSND